VGSHASNLSTSHHANSNIYHPPTQYHEACLILHQEFVYQPSSTSFSIGAVFIFSAATFGLYFDTTYSTEVYLHRKIFYMSDKRRAGRVKLMDQKCRHQNIIPQEL